MLDSRSVPRRRAVIIFGGMAMARYRDFARAAAVRDVDLLVIDSATEKNRRIARRHAAPHGALEQIREITWAESDDIPSVLAAAVGWSDRYELVGAMCLRESYVIVYGTVTDLLRIPGPGLRATTVCRNKALQRAHLPEWSPRSLVWQPGDAVPTLSGTVVVKPLDQHSSRGVVRVISQRELDDVLSRSTVPLMVEDFVAGPEFSVEAVVHDKRLVFAGVTAKETNEQDGTSFVETGHTVPAPLRDRERAALVAATADCLARLDFRTGIVHAEWRLERETGEPNLMELAARCPGDSILALYHLAYGTSLEEILLDAVTGRPHAAPIARRAARQVYADQPVGALAEVSLSPAGPEPVWLSDHEFLWPPVETASAGAVPRIVGCFVIDIARGDQLRPFTSSEDRAVTVLLDAATPDELTDLEKKFRAHLSFRRVPMPEGAEA